MTAIEPYAVADAVVYEVLSADDAKRLTDRIRYCALSVRDGMEKLHLLVQQAKAGDVHTTLGYPSWTAYVSDVLSGNPLRLDREHRQELVGFLAGEGMSTRAIAPIVGVSHETVRQDQATVKDLTVERPAMVTSLDGRERPAKKAGRLVQLVPGERRKRIDSSRIMGNTVDQIRYATEPSPAVVALVIFAEIDEEQMRQWSKDLAAASKSIQRLQRTLWDEISRRHGLD